MNILPSTLSAALTWTLIGCVVLIAACIFAGTLHRAWLFWCADRSWSAGDMFDAPLPITVPSAHMWAELDVLRDRDNFAEVETWREDVA